MTLNSWSSNPHLLGSQVCTTSPGHHNLHSRPRSTGDVGNDLFNSRLGSGQGALFSIHADRTPLPITPQSGGLGLRSPVLQLPPFSLTLVRVGGGQNGAVFPLHLLHVFSNLVNKAPDLFHLGTQVSGVRRKTVGTQREDGPTLGAGQPLLESPKHGLCFAK